MVQQGLYKQISSCLYAIIIDALGFGLVYPVLTSLFMSAQSPILPSDAPLALRHFYLGLGFMLYPFCMLFGTSFMGDLSDNFGRKKVLIGCMAGICVSFLIMGMGITIGSILLLMLGRSASGLVAGSQPIAQAAVADLSTPATKAKNMSILSFSYCIGSVLGPVLGGVTSDQAVMPWFNYATPFYLSSILAAVALAWLYLQFNETYSVKQKKPLSFIRPLQIFSQAFHHPKLRKLALVFLLMQIGFSIYFQFIVVLMKYNHSYSNFQLGTLQGMIGVGFALGLLVGVPLSLKFWQILPITLVTGVITGLLQILTSILHQDVLQWPLAISVALFDIIAFTGMLTLFSDAVSKNSQGFAMGIANAVMALSWALTGLFSNFLNIMGSRGLIFIGGICLVFGSSLLLSNVKPGIK